VALFFGLRVAASLRCRHQVDGLDDLSDLAAGLGQIVHGEDHVFEILIREFHPMLRFRDQLGGSARAVGTAAGHGVDLFGGDGGLLDGGGLLATANSLSDGAAQMAAATQVSSSS
jgi:hypothetical protein